SAQLLWDHGGEQTVQNRGAALLQRVSSPNFNLDPELLIWYISRGVQVDDMHGGQTALHHVVHQCDGYFHDHTQVIMRIKIFLQEGALLGLKILMSEHCRNGYNTPQIIKEKIEHNQ